MTQKQIEYFQKVCEKGNISLAAEDLFVSRSVISRAILELEEEFEAQLFFRSRNGVTLTESGQILQRLFDTFTVSYDTARERIRCRLAESRVKTLRLGITPTNAYCVYENYLLEFQKLQPEICLFVEEHGAFEGGKLLLEGKLDAFFSPAKPDPAVFDSMELYQNPIMLGVAEGDTRIGARASMADLVDLPLAYYNFPMPLEHILKAGMAALGAEPKVVLKTSDRMLLQNLTKRRIIYPILPLDMMATWDGVRQVEIDFFQPSLNRLIWSRALKPCPSLELFLTYMRKQLL